MQQDFSPGHFGILRQECQDALCKRAFPAARFADDAKGIAVLESERNPVEGPHLRPPLVVIDGEITDREHAHVTAAGAGD